MTQNQSTQSQGGVSTDSHRSSCSKFVPMRLMDPPELGDDSISELHRVSVNDGSGEVKSGISFMVNVPPGCDGTEIVLTVWQLRKLAEFASWRRVPARS